MFHPVCTVVNLDSMEYYHHAENSRGIKSHTDHYGSFVSRAILYQTLNESLKFIFCLKYSISICLQGQSYICIANWIIPGFFPVEFLSAVSMQRPAVIYNIWYWKMGILLKFVTSLLLYGTVKFYKYIVCNAIEIVILYCCTINCIMCTHWNTSCWSFLWSFYDVKVWDN